jgi:hypothetical protein
MTIDELRTDMLNGFDGVRLEMTDKFGEVRVEAAAEFKNFRSEMAEEFKNVRSEMAKEFKNVRSEMAEEFKNVRAEMADALNRVYQAIRAEGETTRRHFDVMVEKMSDSVRIVAEATAHHTVRLDNHEKRLKRLERPRRS